jgi:hypothetical protein
MKCGTIFINETKTIAMKKLSLFLGFALLLLAGCKTNANLGEKVNEPFTGNKYESNDRYFRGTGKGQSMDENISRNKADLQAKKVLAQQVETNVKVVTDQYLGETELNNRSEITDKFQSLAREATNTQIADLRKIGEEKYKMPDGTFTTYIAYEIHKRDMYRFMKKQIKLNSKLNDAERKTIEDMINFQLYKKEKGAYAPFLFSPPLFLDVYFGLKFRFPPPPPLPPCLGFPFPFITGLYSGTAP